MNFPVGCGERSARSVWWAWLMAALWPLAGAMLACCLPAMASSLNGPPDAVPGDFGFIEPYFERVGDPEVIPFGNVTALLQDNKGWLWIGTQKGLLRYDGYRFRQFLHDPANPASLPGDSITALWQGRDGRLWVGTASDGLAWFDQDSEKFSRLFGPGGPVLTRGSISALVGNPVGGVWIGSNDGLFYAPPGDAMALHWHYDPAQAQGLRTNRIHSLLLARDGALWIGTANGLQRRKSDSQVFEWIASDPADPASLAGQEIYTLLQASDGKLWIGTGQGGAAWLEQPEALNPAPVHWFGTASGPSHVLGHGKITHIAQPVAGEIWFATFGAGVAMVNAKDGAVLRQLRHDPANPGGLGSDLVNTMLIDAAGMLWLGSSGGGLQRYRIDNHAFRLLRYSPLRPAGLSHGNVRSLLELADGRILVGTVGNGIDIIDRQRGLIGGYRPAPGQAGTLSDGFVMALAQTPDGAIWVGTRHHGVQRLAPGSSRWQRYAMSDGLPHDSVRTLLVARDGSLWAGTQSGLARWNAGSRRFEPMLQHDRFALQARVNVLAQDQQGRLWCGTDQGLWVVEPGTAWLNPIRHEANQADGLSSDEITGLLAPQHGALWVATRKGVSRLTGWDGKVARFDHVTTRVTGVAQYISSSLLQDRLGRIWTGEYVLDPQTAHLYKLSRADGFGLDVNWASAYLKIKTIVRDLRAFTRLDEAEKKAVHLSECLLATMHLVRTRYLEQVEFITEFTDDPAYECWPALLNQVFMNLLVNGCQAIVEQQKQSGSSEKGKLWLRLYRQHNQLRVEFEDQGCGMSPEVQARILEPFFTTKEVGSGTGLGLSISYGIIQKHQGSLDIRSQLGQGSRFVVLLPLDGP